MAEILVIASHRSGELNPGTLEVITAATELKQATGNKISVVIIADKPDQYVKALSVGGVDEIIKVSVPQAEFQPDYYESVVLAVADERKPQLILAPHGVDAWSFMPVVAAKRRYGCATDVFEIRYEDGKPVAVRAAYAEKMHMELDFPHKETVVLTIRGNTYKPSETSATPAISEFQAPAVEPRTRHIGFHAPDTSGDVDIAQAEYILSIGRGIAEEDNVEQFNELADQMGFTLGCSRPIADNGWLPKSRQVGQSGKTVSNCKLYLAMGISGSVQHMAGMKHVQTIVAVNTDAEASIFNIARYGIVADLFDIAEELKQHFQ